eukprot:TRINITY_DN79284_c0_g1_i1.p1 TRINITY_DN79284_c0_g1~~TRINITY_DN79284_c0_g1_i1.p1  ORF type:complete len:615 (-),score=95.89 TRINITY_DN79284_c0_g1_i1:21-1865(-)
MGTVALGCCAHEPQHLENVEELVACHQGHAEAQAKLLAVWDQLLLAQKRQDESGSRWKQGSRCAPRCCPVVGLSQGSCLHSIDASLDSDADWCSHGGSASSSKRRASEAVCCLVRAEWFESRYSGLFRKADFGLARLSIMKPQEPLGILRSFASLFSSELEAEERGLATALALKFFRGGEAPSGNLLLVGQASSIPREDGVLGQCLCSQSAQVGCDGPAGSAQASGLTRHSAWPHATGLSAFATLGQDGRETRGGLEGDVVECPWALVLKPLSGNLPPASTDSGELCRPLARILQMAPGTTLYEVFACPSPGAAFEAGWVQLIGRIVTASKFIREPHSESMPQLRFRHQRKEEDYMLRPEWLQELNASHSACGSEHFRRLLERRQRTLAAQGGAFTPDLLPCQRWVWSNSLKVPQLSSFSFSTSATESTRSHPSSPTSSSASASRESLAAALRQRGGRLTPAMQTMPALPKSPRESEQEEIPTGSACPSMRVAMALAVVLLIVVAPSLQRPKPNEVSDGPLVLPWILIVLIALLYRTCRKCIGGEDEEDNFQDCAPEEDTVPTSFADSRIAAELRQRRGAGLPPSGLEHWRQDSHLHRERTLVRTVSAHELELR